MRTFHTAISFLIIIAVTVVVLGLFAKLRPEASESGKAEAPVHTEPVQRLLLCI